MQQTSPPQQRARASARSHAHPDAPAPTADEQRREPVQQLLNAFTELHGEEIDWARRACSQLRATPLPAPAPGTNRMDRAAAAGALTELRRTRKAAEDLIVRLRLQTETALDILSESAVELRDTASRRYDEISEALCDGELIRLEEQEVRGEQAIIRMAADSEPLPQYRLTTSLAEDTPAIDDPTSVPGQYKVPDKTAIRAALASGETVPGARRRRKVRLTLPQGSGTAPGRKASR